jgi:hypothetical protein
MIADRFLFLRVASAAEDSGRVLDEWISMRSIFRVFYEEIEELREIPELRKKFNKLDQGWQPAARKLFPVILLPIGKFR